MSTITGKTFYDEIGDSTVNTKAGKVNARGLGDEINPSVGKPYLVTGGEHDKLYAHMVKEEGGKFYFGVGKDPKEAEQHYVLDENLVVIDKANLAYITDAQKKDAEPEDLKVYDVQVIDGKVYAKLF
jgi:curli biogenesis system outer membrane secretion channel CsgG